MLDYLKRFKNTGTLLSLVGLVVILLQQFGLKFDSQQVNNIAQTVCSILIILGICNNPNSNGLDHPFSKEGEK